MTPSNRTDSAIADLLGCDSAPPPPYSSDLRAAWDMEEALLAKGLEREYEATLWDVIFSGMDTPPQGASFVLPYWQILHATALQRAQAALVVLQRAGGSSGSGSPSRAPIPQTHTGGVNPEMQE